MKILTTNHWTEVRNPYGRVRAQTKGADGDCNPIGRAIKLDTSELPETNLKTKEPPPPPPPKKNGYGHHSNAL